MTPEQREHTAARRRRHRRLRAYGRWVEPLVDPTPAREHVGRLRTYGISNAAVALLAHQRVELITQLTTPTDPDYRQRIRRETEAAIRDARFDLDELNPRMLVNAAGTQRRIRALVAIGWSNSALAARLGYTTRAALGASMLHPRRRYVTAANARAVRDLYEQLAMTRGPSVHAVERARVAGWAPPWAWDDDTIDHPDTLPDLACLVRPSTRSSGDVLEDVRWILDHEPSLTKAQVAARLGMEPDAVSAAITRAADAAGSAVRFILDPPFGPWTRDVHDQVSRARAGVLAVREQMTDNAVAAGHNVTRRGRKEDAA